MISKVFLAPSYIYWVIWKLHMASFFGGWDAALITLIFISMAIGLLCF